jgi:hypothetical protein
VPLKLDQDEIKQIIDEIPPIVPESAREALRRLLQGGIQNGDAFERILRENISEEDYQRFGPYLLSRAFSPLDCYSITTEDKFG